MLTRVMTLSKQREFFLKNRELQCIREVRQVQINGSAGGKKGWLFKSGVNNLLIEFGPALKGQS